MENFSQIWSQTETLNPSWVYCSGRAARPRMVEFFVLFQSSGSIPEIYTLQGQ